MKLCDFGWSIFAPEKTIRSTLCGTPEYVPPEMLKNGQENSWHDFCQYDVRYIDVWSLGVLAVEMIDGDS